MQQQPRGRRLPLIIAGGVLAVVLVAGTGVLIASAGLPDQAGAPVGVTAVVVGPADTPGPSVPAAQPSGSPTVTPTPSTSVSTGDSAATGAATVPDPAPLPADDHGGRNGNSGKGGGSDD